MGIEPWSSGSGDTYLPQVTVDRINLHGRGLARVPFSERVPPTYNQVVPAGARGCSTGPCRAGRSHNPEREISGKGERAVMPCGGGCARGDNSVICVLSRAADSASAAEGCSYAAGGALA